jgi:hypothetical protein
MDEYAHVLLESEGLSGKDDDSVAAGLAEAMTDALSLRTTTLSADDFKASASGILEKAEAPIGLRSRFAVRFGEENEELSDERTRKDQLRAAFNSPFWPFVLATTSVGQEGLDFHPYCHVVVHWNLPTNPVDLEQREGRVHRYKGHAVRKNVALKHSVLLLQGPHGNPWEALFAEAVRHRAAADSDLVPYWVYPVTGGASIERHVPALPLSRERDRIEALRRSLVVYRMVFGQPRQEDLISFLLRTVGPDVLPSLAASLRIDLSPPHSEVRRHLSLDRPSPGWQAPQAVPPQATS